ncbi:MAG: glycine--tRNA ligase subunit beta [Dictyoglomus sp. NZ13-RE01]|nr:MAG: glycine--tRNA ligase subunit beta [Dictyoglomus sp. NZ13-RE01]
MAKDLIFELGTEEMPASFLRPALSQMKELAESELKSNFLEYKDLNTFATPRRLIIYVSELEEYQKEQEEEIRGPAYKVAFNNGEWQEPAKKFAQQYGLTVNDLYVKETEKGTYVYLKRKIKGKETREVLPGVIRNIIARMRFPKMMKWGDVDFVFGRPIKWILFLYGEEKIDLEIAKVKADYYSYTPRFLPERKIEIRNAKDYFKLMEENFVIVDQEERKKKILEQADNIANKYNFKLDYSQELIEELTFLVEYPTAFLGEFDKRFLDLPDIVLKVTMEKKQRYFPLQNLDGKLVNYFIGIRNGLEKDIEIVKEGNEKVIKARLSDAEYYYNEDKKEPLEKYTKKLDGIIFHENLGSIKDKVERVRKLVSYLEEYFNLNNEEREILNRAVELYKADLGTLMVSEYPELHGIMGEIYALKSGERKEVANIIKEYIFPRTSEDDVSENFLANLLSIADRIDSLTGYFKLNLFPTGSEDPLGLRRLTNGLIKILWEKEYRFKIFDGFKKAWDIYGFEGDIEYVWGKADEFFTQRLRNFLIDKNYPVDLVNGVLALGFDPIYKVKKRLSSVIELQKDMDLFGKIYTSANRLARIIPKDFTPSNSVNTNLLVQIEEKALYQKYQELIEKYNVINDYLEFLKSKELLELCEQVDRFFDNVLVMSPNEEEKRNRLTLIMLIKNIFWEVIDWSKITKV